MSTEYKRHCIGLPNETFASFIFSFNSMSYKTENLSANEDAKHSWQKDYYYARNASIYLLRL